MLRFVMFLKHNVLDYFKEKTLKCASTYRCMDRRTIVTCQLLDAVHHCQTLTELLRELFDKPTPVLLTHLGLEAEQNLNASEEHESRI